MGPGGALPALGAEDYRATIARSLGYFQGDARHFSVTEPWTPLIGGMMACVRIDVPDGAGGFAPSSDFSMYQIEQGRIVAMVKDNTIFGCPNRTYHPLAPATK